MGLDVTSMILINREVSSFANLSIHIIRMSAEEYKVFTFEFEFLHLNLGCTDTHIRELTFLHNTKCAMM